MEHEMDLIVFDPRGVVETEPVALAPRVANLDGLSLGVSTTPNGTQTVYCARLSQTSQNRPPLRR